MSFSNFTVAALNAVNIDGGAVAVDFNGHIGDLDLGAPMTFIDDKYKIVLSNTGQMDLIATIAHVLHACQSYANRGITQGDIDMAMPIIALRFNTYSFLALVSKTDIPIVYRGSDVITDVVFANGAVNRDASVAQNAMRIYNFVRDNDSAKAAVGSNAFLLPIALVANKRHRDEEKGHNWYTNEANNAGSTASKLLAMAGKRKDMFAAFMGVHGHDAWHFLSTGCIEAIADSLCGMTDNAVNGAHMYLGSDVDGQMLYNIVDVGEACTDRYNGSIIGVSSLILGVNYIKFFITQVSIKVPGIKFAAIDKAITALNTNLQRDGLSRDEMLAARSSLAFTISFTVGFCTAFGDMEDDIRKHKSIVKFADANVAGKATGMALGKSVKDMEIDDEAMVDVLKEVVNNMAVGMVSAANETKRAGEEDLEIAD